MRTYDTYKDSGISWLWQIPSHWDVKRAKVLFNKENRPVLPNDEVVTCFRDGQVTLRKNRRTEGFTESLKEIGYQGIRKGDLVIHQMDAFAGATGVSDSNGKGTPVYHVCTPKTDYVNNYYYAHIVRRMGLNGYIQSLYRGIRERSSDFRFDVFGRQFLPVPPLTEQKAIVAYLDKATAEIDKAIASQQRMVELLQERKQIIINQAVTQGLTPDARLKDTGINWLGLIPAHWEARKLKSICKYEKYSIKTGPFGTQLKGDDLMQNGAVRVYNQKNVIENSFDDVQFYVSKEKARELNSFYTQPQDLLITSRGTIGKCSILPENAPMGLLHPCLIAIRINQKICDLNWAQIFISSSSFFSTNIFLNSNATTIEVIYTDTLKNVVIPLPPLSEQQEIVAYIKREARKVDHALQQTKLKIELLTERKQILINDVVTGKIKVV